MASKRPQPVIAFVSPSARLQVWRDGRPLAVFVDHTCATADLQVIAVLRALPHLCQEARRAD